MIFKPHTTVASIVERDGQYLMVEESIRRQHLLNQPAGHLDADEALCAAAVRETLEETGCQIEVTDLVGIYQWVAPDNGRQFLRFTFAATLLSENQAALLDTGIVRTHWLTRAQIANHALALRSPVILESIDHYEAGIRHPLSLIQWVAS